jgi:hypothetical protein
MREDEMDYSSKTTEELRGIQAALIQGVIEASKMGDDPKYILDILCKVDEEIARRTR